MIKLVGIFGQKAKKNIKTRWSRVKLKVLCMRNHITRPLNTPDMMLKYPLNMGSPTPLIKFDKKLTMLIFCVLFDQCKIKSFCQSASVCSITSRVDLASSIFVIFILFMSMHLVIIYIIADHSTILIEYIFNKNN